MHTLALPKSVLCIEFGPQWPMAHYELAYLTKKKLKAKALREDMHNMQQLARDEAKTREQQHA